MAKPIHVELKIEQSAFFETMRRIQKLHGVVDVLWQPEKVFRPNGAAKPKKEKRVGAGTGRTHPSGTSGGEFLLKLLEKGPLATGGIRAAFEADGRSGASTASVINSLKNQDLIKYDGKATGYALTKKMKDRLRHRKEAKTQQPAKE